MSQETKRERSLQAEERASSKTWGQGRARSITETRSGVAASLTGSRNEVERVWSDPTGPGILPWKLKPPS